MYDSDTNCILEYLSPKDEAKLRAKITDNGTAFAIARARGVEEASNLIYAIYQYRYELVKHLQANLSLIGLTENN